MGMGMGKGGGGRGFRLLPMALATVVLLILSGCTAARNAVTQVSTETPSIGTPGTTPGTTPGSSAGGSVLVATLAAEAPNTAGSGTARLVMRPEQQTICYVIHVTGIAAATEAHIHKGAEGTNGPVVVPFTTPNAQGVSTGCTHVAPALITSITQHPADYYVNIHNAAYPDGAVRGQLSTCGPHMNC